MSLPWLCCSSEDSALGLWHPYGVSGAGKWHSGLGLIDGSVAESAIEFLPLELLRVTHTTGPSRACLSGPGWWCDQGRVQLCLTMSPADCYTPQSSALLSVMEPFRLEKPFKIIESNYSHSTAKSSTNPSPQVPNPETFYGTQPLENARAALVLIRHL